MLRTTTRHSALLCLAAPLALALGACDQQQNAAHTPPNQTTADDVGQEMNEAATAAGEYAENQYAALKAEIDQGVERVNEQIVSLRNEASDASDETKDQIDAAIASLEEQRDELMADLEDAADSTGEAWDEMQAGLTSAWQNLKDSADRAIDRFDA